MLRTLCVLLLLATVSSSADTVVQLDHGGQLSGKQFNYSGTDVLLFLGVPYAKPPVGELRFSKPQDFPAWSGVRQATTVREMCPQYDIFTGSLGGEEDCLYLDISIPGPINTTALKPVMVWIHGGGYITGSKNLYPGAALAVHGDVIVVALNYRLGALGFLSDDSGAGNFGLWDQRAALIWVQDNIDKFGGDPNLVTIFGESAGAGSVAAQTIGQHNDGLFKRAIQESGTLFTGWSWYLSERKRKEIVLKVKNATSCPKDESVFECLRKLTVEEIFAKVQTLRESWHPVPDSDFFSSNVVEESFDRAKRYDLMSGMNGQEGLTGVAALGQVFPLDTGYSTELIRGIISGYCSEMTSFSIELCVDFLMNKYEIISAPDNKERTVILSFLLGEIMFNIPIVNQLSKHSTGNKTTYAYYFNELLGYRLSLLPAPEWLIRSADHAEEVPFVIGFPYFYEHGVVEAYQLNGSLSDQYGELLIFLSATDYKYVSDLMMTAWSNFAKSGNPNKPMALPYGFPEWPEYDTVSNQFMELNFTNPRVITTPHKDRLDAVFNNIFTARSAQVLADQDPNCEKLDDLEDKDDEEEEEPPKIKPTVTSDSTATGVISFTVVIFSILVNSLSWF